MTFLKINPRLAKGWETSPCKGFFFCECFFSFAVLQVLMFHLFLLSGRRASTEVSAASRQAAQLGEEGKGLMHRKGVKHFAACSVSRNAKLEMGKEWGIIKMGTLTFLLLWTSLNNVSLSACSEKLSEERDDKDINNP